MDPIKNQAILEALLFTTEEPLSVKKLLTLLPEMERDELKQALDAIDKKYEIDPSHGIHLDQVASGYQFRTNSDLAPWVQRLFQAPPLKLSKAVMETLAIIAYRQPVTKAEIESIRGVDSTGTLRTLQESEFIRIVGRKEMPGRPVLFGTTNKFLEVFGLNKLDELPPLEEHQDFDQLQPKLPIPEDAPIQVVLEASESDED